MTYRTLKKSTMGSLMVNLLSHLIILGLTSSKPTGGSYESSVKQWEADFQATETITCIINSEMQSNHTAKIVQSAKEKLYPSTLESTNEHATARIVNMYTKRSCLYVLVNDGLRKNSLSDTYNEFSTLLIEAIDILSEELNDGCSEFNAYRGTAHCDEITKVGRTTLKSFTSTSTDPKVPYKHKFKCTIYISFKKIQGLYVPEVSDFPEEKEVLMKPSYQIDVTEYITDENEIVKKMNDISANFADEEIQQIKTFVRATSVISTSDEALVCNTADSGRHLTFHTLILCLIPMMTTEIN